MAIELRRMSNSAERYQFQGPKGLPKDAWFFTLHPGGTVIKDTEFDFSEAGPGVYVIELRCDAPKGAIIEARRTGYTRRQKST